MSILDDAQARADARARAYTPINYALMNQRFPKQKAALTRAIKRIEAARPANNWDRPGPEHKAAVEALAALCKKTVKEWNECGAWPDDWSRWQVALDDALGWRSTIRLEDL